MTLSLTHKNHDEGIHPLAQHWRSGVTFALQGQRSSVASPINAVGKTNAWIDIKKKVRIFLVPLFFLFPYSFNHVISKNHPTHSSSFNQISEACFLFCVSSIPLHP